MFWWFFYIIFNVCYFLVFTYSHFPFCFKYEARFLIKKKKHFYKIIVWITNVVKICFKMWQNIVFSPNYPWRMNCCCLQHVTKWNQLDFVACCRQQNSKSKMLQDNNLTMGDPVKHFHSTCKKHVFVAAAPANFPGSLAV